jgi:hypothetical protein
MMLCCLNKDKQPEEKKLLTLKNEKSILGFTGLHTMAMGMRTEFGIAGRFRGILCSISCRQCIPGRAHPLSH